MYLSPMAENKTWREKTLFFHAKGLDIFVGGDFDRVSMGDVTAKRKPSVRDFDPRLPK